MAKYKNTHYYEAPRMFWTVNYEHKYDEKLKRNVYKTADGDKYKKFHELSVYSKWLYQTLKEMEHRYTGKENDTYTVVFEGVKNPKNWFYAGIEKLSYLSGISPSQIKRCKKELMDAGLIKTCVCHLLDKRDEKTRIHVTGYRVFGETELKFEPYL